MECNEIYGLKQLIETGFIKEYMFYTCLKKKHSQKKKYNMLRKFIRVLLLILLVVLKELSSEKRELTYKLIKETRMGLIYEVGLASSVSPDVVKRALKVVVDGVETVTEVDTSSTSYVLSPIKEGANVTVSLQDVDDAGNASEWASASFVAKDTLPPDTPGVPTIKLIKEVIDPASVVEGEA